MAYIGNILNNNVTQGVFLMRERAHTHTFGPTL